MGGCCTRQADINLEKNISFQYPEEENLKINKSVKPELKLERKNSKLNEEEINLLKIINELNLTYDDKVSTITEIELLNLAIYYKESYINSEYLIFDMRKSAEQKEEYLKRIKHINYTYDQIKNIEKINKLENLKNFIDGKKIIIIIAEYYLNESNNLEGFKTVDTFPKELCSHLYNINHNISFKILNSTLTKTESKLNKFEEYLSPFHSYNIIPFILFSYSHMNTFYKEGFFYISFFEEKIFSFEDYIQFLSEEKENNSSEKNKFLKDMEISCIIIIENNELGKDIGIKEYQHKSSIFKEITLNKNNILINRDKIGEICNFLKNEIQKGNSCYFNIENFNNTEESASNDWIFVIIIILTFVTEVDVKYVINYLREKMIYISNISEIIDNSINKEEISDFFK
jgi:hypothetical protein